MEERYNIFSPTFRKDSYSIYAELRKNDPIYCLSLDKGQKAWLITRYRDCVSFLKEGRLTMNPSSLNPCKSLEDMDSITHHLLNMDPPKHRELRKKAQRAIAQLMNKKLQVKVEEVIQDAIISLQDYGQSDLIKDYAERVTTEVLSGLLGTSVEDYNRIFLLGKCLSTSSEDKRNQAIREILDMLTHYIERKKRKPEKDFICYFLTECNHNISPKELYSMLVLFVMAGQETTTHLIGNGLFTFLHHPGEFSRLIQNKQRIYPAMEEVLRYTGPVEIASNRWAKEEMVWGGKRISKGDMVTICLASANRDEEQFRNPDSFQVVRRNNHHIALGHGIHACLGGVLTRMIATTAISLLLQEVEAHIRIPLDQIGWKASFWIRGYESIPVHITRRI